MKRLRKIIICFFAVLAVGACSSSRGDCMRLCDDNFWDSNPTIDDLKAELARGANINGSLSTGRTPLHSAAHKGTPENLRFLIDQGANIHARTRWRKSSSGKLTPLHFATLGWSAEKVRILLEGGARVNAKDGRGETPLHYVAVGPQIDVVNILLDEGARVTLRDDHGRTPLHRAVDGDFSAERVQAVNILLDAGADASLQDGSGQTPYDLINDHYDPYSFVNRGSDWRIKGTETYERLKAASGK